MASRSSSPILLGTLHQRRIQRHTTDRGRQHEHPRMGIQNYRLLGEKMGYEVEVVRLPAVLTAEEYHSRNTHGVPLEVIERMMAEYE